MLFLQIPVSCGNLTLLRFLRHIDNLSRLLRAIDIYQFRELGLVLFWEYSLLDIEHIAVFLMRDSLVVRAFLRGNGHQALAALDVRLVVLVDV